MAPFYRNMEDELPTSSNIGGIDIDEDLSYSRLNVNWTLGIKQGILPNDLNKNILPHLFILYKGRLDKHFRNHKRNQVIFNRLISLPDMDDFISIELW
jgi:hypothetical protein